MFPSPRTPKWIPVKFALLDVTSAHEIDMYVGYSACNKDLSIETSDTSIPNFSQLEITSLKLFNIFSNSSSLSLFSITSLI